MNNQYNLQFDKLCTSLKLGEILVKPEAISGGLLHRMFAIETSQGKYAIKALNPQIMARPTALNNFIRSERIVSIAAHSLPANPAKTIDGKVIQFVDNQYYLVFDWIDGVSLKSNQINKVHCEKIGTVLAHIHRTDFSEIETTHDQENTKQTDWNQYLHKGLEIGSVWVDPLHQVIEKLFVWAAKAKRSSDMLATEKVIGHRDLEPKNVMWDQENPIIIDWESAGYINPMHDLVETSIYWSINEIGSINKERLLAFIKGYQQQVGVLSADWRLILEHGYSSKLDWLEYNLKRSVWIECADENEQQMGTLQVTGTITAIRQYEALISELEVWLNKDTRDL